MQSGPLGANAVPGTIEVDGTSVPFNPLKDVAFAALDHAYAFGYVVCGIATLVAAVIAVLAVSTPTRPLEEPSSPPTRDARHRRGGPGGVVDARAHRFGAKRQRPTPRRAR